MSEERLIGMSRGGGAMTCMRCGGFVIIDRYAWPGSEMENLEVPQAHCVNCGWTEDPVIRANRMLMAMGKLLHLNVPRVVHDPLEWSDSSPSPLQSWWGNLPGNVCAVVAGKDGEKGEKSRWNGTTKAS
jgi:hypothetical protein